MSPDNVRQKLLDGLNPIGYKSVKERRGLRQPMQYDFTISPSVDMFNWNIQDGSGMVEHLSQETGSGQFRSWDAVRLNRKDSGLSND